MPSGVIGRPWPGVVLLMENHHDADFAGL